jgi:hypothetical protein
LQVKLIGIQVGGSGTIGSGTTAGAREVQLEIEWGH